MFGRLPWLAFERRIRAFFFFVFFDIVPTRYRQTRLITPLTLPPPCSTVRIGHPARVGFSAHIRLSIGVRAPRSLRLAPSTWVHRDADRCRHCHGRRSCRRRSCRRRSCGRRSCGRRSCSRQSCHRRREHRAHQWCFRPRSDHKSLA
jgi:hypothetical protein